MLFLLEEEQRPSRQSETPITKRKEKETMANNTTPCVKKATIDQEAQQALDAIAPVLANSSPQVTDLVKALKLANATLQKIQSDPHHL
jgi:hypothetical protein